MAGASGFQMPRDNLDTCLSTICAYTDPLAIWNNFKEFMIVDLLINHNSDVAINCERIGLPIPVDDDSQLNDEPTQEQQHELTFSIMSRDNW